MVSSMFEAKAILNERTPRVRVSKRQTSSVGVKA